MLNNFTSFEIIFSDYCRLIKHPECDWIYTALNSRHAILYTKKNVNGRISQLGFEKIRRSLSNIFKDKL